MTKLPALLITLLLFGLATSQSLYTSSAERSVRYAVTQVNESGVEGSVLIADYGRRTVVSVALAGTRPGELHPTHFHLGRCGTGGDIVVLLQSVRGDTGFGVTVLDTPFDDLIGGEYYLNVHRSPSELDTILACGEVGLHATPLDVSGMVEPVEAEPLEPVVEDEPDVEVEEIDEVEVEEADVDEVAVDIEEIEVSVRVAALEDDALEFRTFVNERYPAGAAWARNTSLALLYHDFGGSEYGPIAAAGVRFTGIDIPQGASVISAHLEFTASETSEVGAVPLMLQAEASGHAASFEDQALGDLSNRPRTAASVSWVLGPWQEGERYASEDLSAVVQEVVARADWQPGNAMAFIITGGTEGAWRNAHAYRSDPGAAPRLTVRFQAP